MLRTGFYGRSLAILIPNSTGHAVVGSSRCRRAIRGYAEPEQLGCPFYRSGNAKLRPVGTNLPLRSEEP